MREEEEDVEGEEPSTSGGGDPTESTEEAETKKSAAAAAAQQLDPWDLAVAREYENQRRQHKVGLILNKQYTVDCKIGFGTFGSIFAAVNKDTGEKVAVKFESDSTDKSHLLYEESIYRKLAGGAGIPKIHWVGHQHGYNLMVMDLLGPNLEQLLHFCNRKFTVRTVLLLAEQMLQLVRFVHERGYLHRDIKPNNFLIGIGEESCRLFLIDFGLTKSYRVEGWEGENSDGEPQHIPFSQDRHLVGTARYASVNAHCGRELSRRDDLEALGYVLISFLRGSLPWTEVKGKTKKQKYNKIKKSKMHFTPERLCTPRFPKEFAEYLRYCRNLEFQETPDYDYLINLFQNCTHRLGIRKDDCFDWHALLRADQSKRSSWEILFKWATLEGTDSSCRNGSDSAASGTYNVKFGKDGWACR